METISYFGFGANAHPHMIEAIIGRAPHGEASILPGYALAVQSLDDIPDTVLLSAPAPLSPRSILSRAWGSSFRSYTLQRDDMRDVWGTMWQVTKAERELISKWELVPYGWSSELFADALFRDGSHCPVTTEWIFDQPIERVVEGRCYPRFIVPEADLLRVAREMREAN